MKYLVDHYHHFQGNAYQYTMQCALKDSHYPNEEASLFDYLLTSTFGRLSYTDMRAAQVFSIHLPYPWRAIVVQVLYQYELYLAQEYGSDAQPNIALPSFTLSKLSSCLQERIPSPLLLCLSSSNPLEDLSRLFGVNVDLSSADYIPKALEKLLAPSGIPMDVLRPLCDLTVSGDRHYVAMALGNLFGYPSPRLNELSSAVTLWYSAHAV